MRATTSAAAHRESTPSGQSGSGRANGNRPDLCAEFYRNAIDCGFYTIESKDAVERINDGDEVQIDYDKGIIEDKTNGQRIEFRPLPDFALEIIKDGGLLEHIKEKQLNESRKIKNKGDKDVAKSVKSYKIAVIGGDGTGPEVTAEAVKVIERGSSKFGFKLDLTPFDFGGERYKRTGETLPDSAIANCGNSTDTAGRDRSSGC